ncbi:MAG: putative sulfate exporter family transporter [Gammaproteobacteria bacterium]|nr:MAG: putative sulfate exporter family transporter [Gammaproteobacteria bacterium]RKZ43536.1 MAG: putative sulfate exporter family transporter [Gammaproteobacteria bacterium]RKZ73327.1 MAG: putative sulfate exporter family transporter [Gammaproteobacteria bacterium]
MNRKWYSGMLTTEDWWAVWLGLIMLFAGLTSIWGVDLVGWMAKTQTWVWGDFSWQNVLKPSGYKEWHPLLSLFVTYLVFTALTCLGAWAMKLNVKKFFLGWTIIFLITWAVWIIGHEAHFKAHTHEFEKYGITWSLSLGGGFSYMLALLVGLIIGNFFKGFAAFLSEAAKPEWFIKTAIVYLGIKIGIMTMQDSSKTMELAIAGMGATFVAYLLFWPIVYTVARKIFRLSRAAAAVLSSGISICGVSAAIATAGAIRAKPILPVMVSVLIVVFAMVELVILPGFYTYISPDQPIVNGAAMGMTVKTDGADGAAGAILDELMRANAVNQFGIVWEEGWILSAAVMTKIWIDVFLGVWAFILALVWVYNVEQKTAGHSTVPVSEIWHRFPKFVVGYFVAWFIYLGIAMFLPDMIEAAKQGANIVQSPMRKMMFMLTFVSIGIITDFSKLKGMGRLTLLYAIALFLIIAPIAYIVAWIFHHGMMPPVVG